MSEFDNNNFLIQNNPTGDSFSICEFPGIDGESIVDLFMIVASLS